MQMTRRRWEAALAVVLWGGFLFYVIRLIAHPLRADWIPENAIVIDSAQIRGSPTAYLFVYNTGALGYSIKMVSLGTVSHKQAVIKSDYIRGIRWNSTDTLIVELEKAEYTPVRAHKSIVVVPIVTNSARD